MFVAFTLSNGIVFRLRWGLNCIAVVARLQRQCEAEDKNLITIKKERKTGRVSDRERRRQKKIQEKMIN